MGVVQGVISHGCHCRSSSHCSVLCKLFQHDRPYVVSGPAVFRWIDVAVRGHPVELICARALVTSQWLASSVFYMKTLDADVELFVLSLMRPTYG